MPAAEPRHPALLPAGWPTPPGVHAFTTLRFGAGVSQAPFDTFNLGNRYAADGDDPATVERNRAELIAIAGLPGAPCWLRQVHGVEVLRVDGMAADADPDVSANAGPGRGAGEGAAEGAGAGGHGAASAARAEPEADASVTATPGRVLAILTADCLPVVFASKSGDEVGAAHAGWRGLADGVLEATVHAMRTAPADLVAWIGPAAGPRRYEIGQDVYDAFVRREGVAASDAADAADAAGRLVADAAAAFEPTRPGHWRVDLPMLARQRLVAAGIAAAEIHGGAHCTLEDPRFFSHRRDRRTGRLATLVWMEPAAS